ncbi:MAG: hypothetical protein JNL54_12345 [Kineosporiaceae bacterium]|nr:hypothetical protein [Kineosporiaceae bacterium]
MKALERKLHSITHGTYTPDDFLIADAKDADMAFGVQAPAPVPGSVPEPGARLRYRTRPQYLEHMAEEVRAGVIDILLTSASNGERLANDGLFKSSDVTLAVRANDSTDIWNPRGGTYPSHPSRPFRTASLERVREYCSLVLYSVTFNNDLEHDLATLEAYAAFRAEAHDVGMRHFLEVFNPNAPVGLDGADVGAFVNDHIIRLLAGVTQIERPLFLKIAFNGAESLAELVQHDPSLVVGILGGSAGTTRDTLELLSQGERAGARVSLFGRKVQRAESQLDLLAVMRSVVAGKATPEQGVQAYHDALRGKGIAPALPLEEDQRITEPVLMIG